MQPVVSICVFLACAWPALLVVAQLKHPRVCTENGCLLGTTMVDAKNLKFEAFLGVPFAKPPVGKLRFKKPLPVEPWTEDYNATESKSPCMQKSFLLPNQPVVGDENCLFLNVYRPKSANTTHPLPVMVFVHGGGYFFGSADPQFYGPERILATTKVILVTLQYRLGVFGFLSTADAHATGNYGMLDQVQALKWVHAHIGAFGGDPQSVTLFGQSAGAAAVQLHLMSPLSRGLFQRAIIMSGSALSAWSLPIEDPLALARKQAKLIGVSEADELTTAELVDVLQYLDAKVLTASMPQLRTWFEHPIVMYRPTVQGASVPAEERFLPDDPKKLWSAGQYMDVPILIGMVPNEGAVASLAILNNGTILEQLNSDLMKLLPPVMAVNGTEWSMQQLKGRYFPDAPDNRWINENNSQQFTKMMTDAWFFYPTVSTLLAYTNRNTCRETTLYSFEFAGRDSFSTLFAQSNASYGVCHSDELPFLFRISDLFEDYAPDSPEHEMSTIWTDFIVDFAAAGSYQDAVKSSCGEARVKTVTFGNAPSSSEGAPSSSAVSVSRGVGLSRELREMHDFWNTVRLRMKTSVLTVVPILSLLLWKGAHTYQTDPVVCIRDGCLQGTMLQNSVGASYPAFLGIPFAKPPVGRLRFANPERIDPWEGKYDASRAKDACIQKVTFFSTDPMVGAEDCLYLNVFTPTLRHAHEEPLPVMTIYRNNSLIVDLNNKFVQLLPRILGITMTDEKLRRLRHRFLKKTPPTKWVTRDNYDEITRLISEAWFLYPMVRSVKQHLANRKHTPTSVFSFRFRGRYSFSKLITGTNFPYGLSHPDEVIYLFRMTQFFPEFPPGSPEAEMSQIWVKFLIDFATEEAVEQKGTCHERECEIMTFANTNNTYFPVSKQLVPSGLEEELYSAHTHQTDPVVCISDGCLRGTLMRNSVGNYYPAFLGIPFAKPPVGRLRFANPERIDPWEGKYDASRAKDACIQKVAFIPTNPTVGVEDCLYLNVFTPTLRHAHEEPMPVMVYIHGGGYLAGSAQLEQRDPARFMSSRRVIVVTFQYRLGVFGFLSTGDRAAPGNFGMKDQVMALRWVKRNIRAFGGDPRRVTIFGESAGGASTQFHLLSPLSRGLFHRAITMSGSALSGWSLPIENPLELALAQARVVGIPDADVISTEQLVEKLREVSADELLNSIGALKLWDIHPITLYHPVVEPEDEPDPFLVEDPRRAWRRGAYASVPWMTGSIPNDGSIVTQTIYRNNSLIADLDNKFVQLLPRILGITMTDEKLRRLRHRFLKSTPPTKWVTRDNYDEITRLMSEAWFLYPMVRSVKQHLANEKRTSTSVYSFRFRGRYSFSKLFTGSDQPYGLSHPDELIYLFRMPLFFPEFPPGSPEAEMCQLWVKFFVDFATKETVEQEGTCHGRECEIVTFANTNNTYFPVSRKLVPGLDEEMFSFWKAIFEDRL
uniref:Carboxylesterase type B domain-containing protein n=1 Tax=Anopheles dirus TaxID=7168 RepID=A0A182NJF8_9DIPT